MTSFYHFILALLFSYVLSTKTVLFSAFNIWIFAFLVKAFRQLYFLKRLSKSGMNTIILTNLYRCTIETLLTGCITVCYGNCPSHSQPTQQTIVQVPQTSLEAVSSLSRTFITAGVCRWHAALLRTGAIHHRLFGTR